MPASAYVWNIDFLHDTHVHPGAPITGVTSGTFTIPTSGHDFHDFTRYRVTLTVTDSSGLQSSSTVTIFPQKVDLTFAGAPAGANMYLDGIAHPTPFVYNDLIGFSHTIEAPDQTINGTTYKFVSWSDGGAQSHTITVPEVNQTYTANYTAVATAPPAYVQVNSAVPQTNQSTVTGALQQRPDRREHQHPGHRLEQRHLQHHLGHRLRRQHLPTAMPTARGAGMSQAIYYAPNIKAAPAATNTVTVTFNTATPYVDIRALEYSGLATTNPFDVGTSASGTSTTATSGTVTTTTPRADLQRRHDHRRLLHRRNRIHQPHHHQPRRRHRRRPHRHHLRRLHRHRTPERHAPGSCKSPPSKPPPPPAVTPRHPRWPSPNHPAEPCRAHSLSAPTPPTTSA